jgi:hypothetical protein
VVAADHLSASQRSTIRRAVQDAIDAHGVDYAMRNTCSELEGKYGISYETIEYLLHDELSVALPEELLTTGARHLLASVHYQAVVSESQTSLRSVPSASQLTRTSP